MALPQCLQQFNRCIAITGSGLIPHSHELVSNLGHGTDYDHGRPFQAAADDAGHTLNGIGTLDRRPAKFHDDHLRCSSLLFQLDKGYFPNLRLN